MFTIFENLKLKKKKNINCVYIKLGDKDQKIASLYQRHFTEILWQYISSSYCY